jgi:hypothetical protein
MAIRRVLEELEARLEPAAQADSSGASKGKLEYKRYGDGRQRMKIKCRGLDLAEGAKLELLSGDRVIAELEVREGRAEIDEERDGSDEAPPLAAGDVVTLCHQGAPLLSGRIYLD